MPTKKVAIVSLLNVMIITIIITFCNYKKSLNVQKSIAMQIYPLDHTLVYVAHWNKVCVSYMVCESPVNRAEALEYIERLMLEKKIIQSIESFYKEKYYKKYGSDGLEIWINFYRASDEFPPGWQPKKHDTNWISSVLDKDSILTMIIPWNATSKEDYRYIFPELE